MNEVLPMLARSITTRRAHERFIADGMFVEIFEEENRDAMGAPCIVVDLSQVGIGLLSDRPFEKGEKVLTSLCFSGEYIKKFAGDVRYAFQVKEGIWRVGIKFDTSCERYASVQPRLRTMELACIEKQLEAYPVTKPVLYAL